MGGGAPVSIQSMTPFPARDTAANLALIEALAREGCRLVRVAVPTEEDARALKELTARSPLPVIADVHFSTTIALLAVANGVACLRMNPGTLKGRHALETLADACGKAGICLRVGINAASLPRGLTADNPVAAMVEAAAAACTRLDALGFSAFKVSLKASDPWQTLEANRRFSRDFDHPLHLGLTEAGLPLQGMLVSAAVMGSLLMDGIGDTLRMSLSGDPLAEVRALRRLLVGLDLLPGVRVVACPGCGRRQMDVEPLARQVESLTASRTTRATVAVMGCPVNGPGEAAHADIALVGATSGVQVFRKGVKTGSLPDAAAAMAALKEMLDELDRDNPR